MANNLTVIRASNPVMMPTLEGGEFHWLVNRHPEFDDKLPTPAEVQELLREVEAVNAPITTGSLEREIGRMVSAYPQKGPDDCKGYILALAENVGGYPADVVEEARRRVVRSCKFLPAVAEVIEVCEELVYRRRNALGHLNAVEVVRARQIEYREKMARLDEVQKRERELFEAATDKLRAALEAEGIVPKDRYDLGIAFNWFKPLREAASHDVLVERGEMSGRATELQAAMSAYASAGDDNPFQDDDAPDYPKGDAVSAA